MEKQSNPVTASSAVARGSAWKKPVAMTAAIGLLLLAVWYLWRNKAADTVAPAATVQSAPAGHAGADRDALSSRLMDLQQTNAVLREQILALTQRTGVLEDALATIGGNQAPASDQMKLDQADYLLSTAQIRLDLFADVAGAIRAFELADQALAITGNPKVAAVRQTLSIELDQLRATPINDVPNLSGRLRGLMGMLPNLSVRMTGDDPHQSRLASLLDRYLVIRREGEAMPVIGRSAWAVREALQIELERAMLALERNQPDLWQQSLASAAAMSEQTLLANSEQTNQFKLRLAELNAINLQAKLPNVGASLHDLRKLSRQPAPASAAVVDSSNTVINNAQEINNGANASGEPAIPVLVPPASAGSASLPAEATIAAPVSAPDASNPVAPGPAPVEPVTSDPAGKDQASKNQQAQPQ